MNELLEEFIAAVADVRRRDFDLLEAAGVPRQFLWSGPMRFGILAMEPDAGGTYEPTEGGELCFVIPASPLPCDDDDIGDLVAWRAARPDQWWQRCGSVPLLNPLAVHRAEIVHASLTIFSSPLAWLRGAGQGAVILDWNSNLRFHLGGVERVVADTLELGERIERRLREAAPASPRIFVMRTA